MEPEVFLDVRHLTHCFHLNRRITLRAVDDVSFQIRRGEIFGLVGESGSGKSTVARCVMSLYRPTGGEIWLDGVNLCDPEQLRQQRASGVALCAMDRMLAGDPGDAAALTPNYLRMAQAERTRQNNQDFYLKK